MKEANTVQLWTERGEALRERLNANPAFKPWDVYPRPRLVREGWINLNGYWDFGANDSWELACDRRILVPFPPESALSGVGDFDGKQTPFLCYQKRFFLEEIPAGKRLLLHCGGADQRITHILFNGTPLGNAETLLWGPLTVELKSPCPGENLLVLCVADEGGTEYPWGKQRDKRGGMWYTPVSGIWQTVWLEWVPETFITDVRCTPTLEDVTVEVFRFWTEGGFAVDHRDYGRNGWEGIPAEGGTVLFEGKEYPLRGGKVVLRPESPRLWTPEDPYLYEFTVVCGEDRVRSYFALRTIGTGLADGVPRLLLNGKPYFFNGLLDQGYWPDGLWTPADPACFADDLLLAKRAGFNMVRKHIKIEPELFYYECDRLGAAVFQDMINCGPYGYLRDTVLPTVGFQRFPHLFRTRSRSRWNWFRLHMEATVRRLYSHPSVVYWTIYNEGWGQQYSTRAYETLKTLDPTRVIDTASGWFRVGKTDVDSRHVYFGRFRMPGRLPRFRNAAATGKPVVLSEFGGYVWKDPGHSFNQAQTYGYKTLETREAWQAAVKALFDEQITPAVPRGLCAAVYTQLSDVEDETNGLTTYDRKQLKLQNDCGIIHRKLFSDP